MSNTSLNLVGLDFEVIKSNLINYLKRSDSPFKDLNFEGSNINQLVDVMSYNSYMNSFYLNMVASEMFLDSAQLRDSVVSHAKELNYVPRSFKSADAKISFDITPAAGVSSILIPKGTTFTSKLGSNSYTFSTDQNVVINAELDANSDLVVKVKDLEIYEGTYTTDTFLYDVTDQQQRFVLSNPTIDVSSLTVRILENNGANVEIYTRASTFLGLSATSKVFFLQGAENAQYEILFGDGVIGRKPQSGAIVVAEYRICNGELPNGAAVFDIDGPIQGQSDLGTITTTSIASGGGINETVESIKFNAPRYYQNQERAVTTSDYENLIKQNFSQVQAVSAYGGEELDPPQFGRVYISVDVQNTDGIPDKLAGEMIEFLKPRSPLSIEPIISSPEFVYISVNSEVSYNINITSLSSKDIETFVKNSISLYNINNLSDFKKSLRFSAFLTDIDESHSSIVSNNTKLTPYKIITPLSRNQSQKYTVDYGFAISNSFKSVFTQSSTSVLQLTQTNIYSDTFKYKNVNCTLEDDGNGKIFVVSITTDTKKRLLEVGTVDYKTGIINLLDFIIQDYSGTGVRIFVTPVSNDISSTKNTIINIKDNDIIVKAVPVRL